MAGHYLLKNIDYQEIITATNNGLGWSALAHAQGTIGGGGHVFGGWNSVTRNTLTQAIGGAALPNRNLLPPHRYLTIPPAPGGAIQNYLAIADWVDRLTHPNGMGLAVLGAGLAAWNAGNNAASILAQAAAGAVSIEVYYISGTDMS